MIEKETFLLLGSNLGDRDKTLTKAINLIAEQIGNVIKCSSLYETAPWGIVEQPAFLNQVVVVNTDKNPTHILELILKMEKLLGRERREKWGSRLIDIDILYHECMVIKKENLQIPHPYLHQRRFTLVPLVEIAPDFVHPILQKTNVQLLELCTDESQVNVYEQVRKK